jgi:hypothetical protein
MLAIDLPRGRARCAGGGAVMLAIDVLRAGARVRARAR